jgi:Holliday junction resolvasome RuvABC endonuclease subunit
MAEACGLDSAAYSASTVRQAVVGNGWATKADVARSLALRFTELRAYLGHDRKWKEAHWHNMFDALALAVYHQFLIKPPSRSR